MQMFKNIIERIGKFFSFTSKNNPKKAMKVEEGMQTSQDTSVSPEVHGNIYGDINITNHYMHKKNPTAEDLTALAEPTAQAVRNRFLFEQAVKHDNWAKVVKGAELDKIENPQELKTGWYLRWSEIAQVTSENDMRMILSKILSGEIKKPNTFSYRTLDCIKNLTKEELMLFKKVAILRNANRVYFLKENSSHGFFDISYVEIMKLMELGFLQSNITTAAKLGDMKKGERRTFEFKYTNPRLIIFNEEKQKFELPMLILTDVGMDIANLLEIDDEEKARLDRYMKEWTEYVEGKGGVTVQETAGRFS